MQQIEEIAATDGPACSTPWPIAGQSILLERQRAELRLDVRDARRFPRPARPPGSPADAIAARLATSSLQDEIRDGAGQRLRRAAASTGLGTAGGFKIMIEDRGDNGPRQRCNRSAEKIVDAGQNGSRACRTCSPASAPTRPGCILDIDRTAAKTMGVSMADVFNTLQVYLGSLYVNDFNRFGRTWQVNVQADQHFREQIDDLKQLKVRNDAGRDGAAWHAGHACATSAGP